jgi:hypothetical protein
MWVAQITIDGKTTDAELGWKDTDRPVTCDEGTVHEFNYTTTRYFHRLVAYHSMACRYRDTYGLR